MVKNKYIGEPLRASNLHHSDLCRPQILPYQERLDAP